MFIIFSISIACRKEKCIYKITIIRNIFPFSIFHSIFHFFYIFINYINDIAGIRIICQFTEDIYKVVDIIRNRADMQIKEEKDYLVNAKKSGYRSYLACRILTGLGHKRCYSLAGGWQLYESVVSERALVNNDCRGLLSN